MKLQSAMEYLMTYGWALLIIVVVLAVLFYLGVFNIGAPIGSICNPYADYLCQNPVLSSSGNLTVNFGEIGSTMSITGTACSKGSASPSFNSISTINLESGQTTPLSFQCPIPSGRIGAPFSGTLWIQYTSATGTVLSAEIGSVSASVSTSSNSAALGQNSVLYVPITITNTQASATPAPFQQMLTIDSAAYSNDINSAWSNVEFTTGPGATGNVLQAWVESGAGNTVSSTIVWVNLPSGIGANSNTVIYMNFMQSNVMSSSGPTGEAPQLSSTYAEYDNGASVFPSLYTNFAGTSAPSGWTASTNPPPDISNGLSLTTTCEYLYTNSNYGLNDAQILDFYGTYPAPTGGANTGLGYGTSVYWDINTNANVNYVVATVGSITAPPSTSVWGIYWPSTSSASFYNNYALLGTATGSLPTTALPIEGQMQCAAGQAITGPFYWLRIRAYPPSGVMPSISFGGAE